MIHARLTTLVFFYLGGFLALVFGNWIAWNIGRIRTERETLRHRLRCTLCSFDFQDSTTDPLPRCPRCGSLNERAPFRTL